MKLIKDIINILKEMPLFRKSICTSIMETDDEKKYNFEIVCFPKF